MSFDPGDLDDWLRPVAPDAPAGPDLSYDPDRQAIEAVFDVAPDEADWDGAVTLIRAQATVTRDVWLAVYLMRAGARGGDLAAVGQGAALLAGLFERFWDTAHPTLEEYGLEGRKGACESLVRIGEFLAPLRRVPLLIHPRLGSFSGADFERFARNGAGEDGYGPFRGAIADTSSDRLDEIAATLESIRESIAAADTVLSTQAQIAGQTGTNFQPTYDALDAIAAAVAPYRPSAATDGAGVRGEPDSASPASAGLAATPAASPGEIGSREDAGRALDAIIRYYVRHEPSSPIPVMLERVKGWIGMDFMAILKDVSPGGMSEATSVLRSRDDEDDQGSSDMM